MSQLTVRLVIFNLTSTLCAVTAARRPAGHHHSRERLRTAASGRAVSETPAGPVTQAGEPPKLYPVWLKGKTGFIDNASRLVIPAKFDHLIFTSVGPRLFSDGMALVRVGGKAGYIDKTGRMVIKPRFEVASDFSESLAVVRVGRREGYIDKTGRFAIGPRHWSAGRFSGGLALVHVGGRRRGYIDKAGEYVWRPSR